MDGVAQQWVSSLLGTPASPIRMPGLSPGYSKLLIQLLAMTSVRQPVMTQVRGFLPLMEDWNEFQAPSFDLS